jgi:endonuclease/exonuclease/phosphatase family metal-dependent hydrolase
VVGVPDRTVRVAAYNVYHNYRGVGRTVGELKKLDPAPDFIFLSEVEPHQVKPMAEALGMPHAYYPDLGRGPDGKHEFPDAVILSKHPLYDGRPLRGKQGPVFGLWATTVVDGKNFALVVVHLWPTFGVDPRHVAFTAQMRNEQLHVILDTWRQEGSPPIVVGGDFNQPALGGNYATMTAHWTDALAALGRGGPTFKYGLLETRIDYLLVSPEWKPIVGDVIQGRASDHRPVWVDLGPAPAGATTRPGTKERK